ncbi:MAG: amidohydrolase family protein, partial [Tepidisphaeraceae bacterium]
SATVRNAEMLRLEKSIGVVETGYEADLIALEKNPLEDIVTIQDPLLVISNGRIGFDRLNVQRVSRVGSAGSVPNRKVSREAPPNTPNEAVVKRT